MARQLKISRVLLTRHWQPFHTMLADRRTTVDSAHAWIAKRGYKISRTSVGRYFRRFRSGSISLPIFSIAPIGEADARRKLHRWIDQLTGVHLVGLATFAGFVLTPASGRGRSNTIRTSV